MKYIKLYEDINFDDIDEEEIDYTHIYKDASDMMINSYYHYKLLTFLNDNNIFNIFIDNFIQYNGSINELPKLLKRSPENYIYDAFDWNFYDFKTDTYDTKKYLFWENTNEKWLNYLDA
jgi:hypothetical protein